MPLQVKKVQLKLKDGNEYKDGDLLFNVDAEAWTVGTKNGVQVQAPDSEDNSYPHIENNAKYWGRQAHDYANAAADAELMGNLATIFENNVNYLKGDYVLEGGKLYLFTDDHPAGSWTGEDAIEQTVSQALKQLRSDMFYENIKIDSFTASPSMIEIGTNPQIFTFRWTTSKVPTSIILNETTITPSSATSTTESVSDDGSHSKTFTLTVQDAGSATIDPQPVSKTITVYWYYKIYSGARAIDTINDTFVKSLTGTLLPTKKATTFVANADGATDYLWFAAPMAWGIPTFKFGANEVEFILEQTVDVELPDHTTVKYYVFKSPEPNNGLTTIAINW